MTELAASPPSYCQDGLQSDEQLSDMLDVQLAGVWPLEKPCFNRILIQEEMKVLDVGCGNGAFAIKLAEAFPNLSLTGVDLEEANIARASRRASSSPAADRVSWHTANAYELSQTYDGIFDVATCRSVLYTLPNADRVVLEILKSLKPEGGIAHFLCEDYGSMKVHPTRLDNQRFWQEGPCVAFKANGCNPHMGRCIYTIATDAAAELGLEAEIRVTQVPVSTSPPDGYDEAQTRATMARIFDTWADYATFIAENSPMSREEAQEHFQDISAACLNPRGYVLWLCTVCQVHLKGKRQ